VRITHRLIRNGAGSGLYTAYLAGFDVHSTNFVGNSRAAIQVNAQTTDLMTVTCHVSAGSVSKAPAI